MLFSVDCAISRTSCRSPCSGESAGICLSVRLQQGADRGQHLPKFVVQFARDVPQRGFLRRNQLLCQIAALRREHLDLRKQPAVIADQVQAGEHNRQQDRGQEKIELALHAIVNFRDSPRRQLLGFVVLHQQPRNRRTQRSLPRLQRVAHLLPRRVFVVLRLIEHPLARIPELVECLEEE